MSNSFYSILLLTSMVLVLCSGELKKATWRSRVVYASIILVSFGIWYMVVSIKEPYYPTIYLSKFIGQYIPFKR